MGSVAGRRQDEHSAPTGGDLLAEALALDKLGAEVIDSNDIGAYAIEYAVRNWPVFPLRGKVPAIAGGRGVLDATTDIAQIAQWWGGRYAGCNIGGRVPRGMIVLDIDPRHDGDKSLAALEAEHGRLPGTLTTVSGRGDGGRHLLHRRPSGKLSSARLGPGIDLKTSSGYVVLPPSIHPDTGKPYTRVDRPVADPPSWLIALLRPEPAHTITHTARRSSLCGHLSDSIADRISASTSWAEILPTHGWRCIDADPDADGARWLHPAATSQCSATVRNGCLFVYSPNTPFDVTETSHPKGYTRFRAYAVLNHDGDLSAAARALAGRGAA